MEKEDKKREAEAGTRKDKYSKTKKKKGKNGESKLKEGSLK